MREETDLRLGIEMDFVPGREDRTQNIIERCGFDYVIGSVHFLGDLAVDWDRYDIWEKAQSPEEVWRRYFETLAEAARSGLFDILAHPDLVKMWGGARPVPNGDPRRYYEPALEAIAESGIAVEVSTAGLRKPVGEIYPARAFLEGALDAGAVVALSSDAHIPEQVGFGYEQALELLSDVGVTELAVFERRTRRLESIDDLVAHRDRGPVMALRSGSATTYTASPPAGAWSSAGSSCPARWGLTGLRRRRADPRRDRCPARRRRPRRHRYALPDSDEHYRDADSIELLREAAALVRDSGSGSSTSTRPCCLRRRSSARRASRCACASPRHSASSRRPST